MQCLRKHPQMRLGSADVLRTVASRWYAARSEEMAGKSKWATFGARRAFLEEMAAKRGIQKAEDWKAVTTKDVVEAGGAGLLGYFGSSLHAALCDSFPEDKSLALATRCRPKVSNQFWEVMSNRKAFLEDFAAREKVSRAEEWRDVTAAQLQEAGGGSLLRIYGGSVQKLISDVLDVPLDLFSSQEAGSEGGRRRAVPRNHWKKPENRRKFMQHLSEVMGVEEVEDWKKVTASDVRREGGGALLNAMGSMRALLGCILEESECERVVQTYERVARGHWSVRENRLQFIRMIAEERGVREAGMWRKVTVEHVREHKGGAGFLAHYNGSLYAALKDLLGEELLDSAADSLPVFALRRLVKADFWLEEENVRAFLLSARDHLSIAEKADWFRVSRKMLAGVPGGSSFLQKAPCSLREALALAFPDEDWPQLTELEGQLAKKSSQRQLALAVLLLFPSATLLEDQKGILQATEDMVRVGAPLELDIFLPQHRLAFEYNGAQHYHEIPFFGPLEMCQRRDEAKRQACHSQGVRLVEVPYWWDGKVESLAATVHAQYPGLLQSQHHA